MKRSVAPPSFSFLAIAPLPGVDVIKKEGVALVAAASGEMLAAITENAPWPVLVWTFLVLGMVCASCVCVFKVSDAQNESKMQCLQVLCRLCLVLKLLCLCWIAYISVHKVFSSGESVCVNLESGIQSCSSSTHWWTISVPALAIQGGLSLLAITLLCMMIYQLRRVSLELRYRSLTHYLEL